MTTGTALLLSVFFSSARISVGVRPTVRRSGTVKPLRARAYFGDGSPIASV
ncbi:MAG TPA: hypothetical protein VGJ67_07550 [Actinomycetota bacterium]